MKHTCWVILGSILFLISARASWADVVELTTGQRVEGAVKRVTSTAVLIEVGGQTISFEREKVRACISVLRPLDPREPRQFRKS